jgi:hypothetical protein
MEHSKEYAKNLKELWADESPCEDDSPPCSALEFDVLPPPVSAVINKLRFQWETVWIFMESGGKLYERRYPKLGRSFFVAIRNEKKTKGYGETPYEAICMWALESKH